MDLNAYHLASLAGVTSPSTLSSAGADFLLGVQAAYDEASEGGVPDEDTLTEIADSAVPVYTFDRWQAFVDLAAWQEDPVGELGADAADLTGLAGVALYLIASRLVQALAENEPVVSLATNDNGDVHRPHGVVQLRSGDPATDRVTCGVCQRSWDDAITTSWTPAPSARCPFEGLHRS